VSTQWYRNANGGNTTINGLSASSVVTDWGAYYEASGMTESAPEFVRGLLEDGHTNPGSGSFIASAISVETSGISGMLATGAKAGSWASRAQAIKYVRAVDKIGSGLGAISVVSTFAEDYRRKQGITKGTWVKGAIGTAGVIFPEFGLVYGVIDLGVYFITDKSLSDRIGDAVDNVH